MTPPKSKPPATGIAEGIRKKSIERAQPTTQAKERSIKFVPVPSGGHTIIDVLCAHALVEAYLDRDYTGTIELARKLAALSERRAA